MAKQDIGKIKMTVIHFETESENATLQENVRAIAHTLTRALTSPQRMPSVAGRLPSGDGGVTEVPPEPNEEDEELDDDAMLSTITSSPTKKNGSARQYPTPQPVDLDLTSGDEPLKTFLEKRAPEGDIKRYLAIAYWLKKYCNIEEVTMHHIYTCYRHMGGGWQVPADAAAPLRAMKRRRYGWMKGGSSKGTYVINHLGENEIEKMSNS